MVGFKTDKITYTEFKNWSQYLEKTLPTKDYQVILFYGNRYLDEFKNKDNGSLFNIGDYSIRLAIGKTLDYLVEYVLSYVEADVLLDILKVSEGYKQAKPSEK